MKLRESQGRLVAWWVCDTGGGSDTGGSDTGGRRMQRREMQLCNNYATVTTTRKALIGAGGEVM